METQLGLSFIYALSAPQPCTHHAGPAPTMYTSRWPRPPPRTHQPSPARRIRITLAPPARRIRLTLALHPLPLSVVLC